MRGGREPPVRGPGGWQNFMNSVKKHSRFWGGYGTMLVIVIPGIHLTEIILLVSNENAAVGAPPAKKSKKA